METIVISEPKKAQTVGEMAANDVRKAEVLTKFGIDFCDRGGISLKTACIELNLDINVVEDALIKSTQNHNYSFEFNKWDPDFLLDYIYYQHHVFFYKEYPAISKLLQKVVTRHCKTYPDLDNVRSLFFALERELIGHFAEEENIVFPLIENVLQATESGAYIAKASIKQLDALLHGMERDHKDAGEILSKLRQVTNNYTPPEGACTNFKLLYYKLKSLEEDLQQHIHLENNLLFPKVLVMKREIARKFSLS